MFSEPNRVQQKSFTAKISKVQVDTDEAARSEDEIVETGFFDSILFRPSWQQKKRSLR